MISLSYDRLAGELVAEAGRFGATVAGADPGLRVPTCPEWTLLDLVHHVGLAYHKSAAIIASRPTDFVPFEAVTVDDPPKQPEDFDGWLRQGAEALVAAVDEVGPETPTSTWTPDKRACFWVRRLTHETVVHRADAAIAVGKPYTLDAELAADGISEGFDLAATFSRIQITALDRTSLRGSEQTLHFHATDDGLGEVGEWLIRRTPEGVAASHEHTKADVAVRAPAADLLLALTGRIPVDDARLEVFGDAALFAHWRENTKF